MMYDHKLSPEGNSEAFFEQCLANSTTSNARL